MPTELLGVIPALLGDIVGGATAPSPTAGSPINLTRGGASEFLRDLQAGKGFGTSQVDPNDVAGSYDAANRVLQGNEQRRMATAASGAAGQAAAAGADNPFAWIEHAKGQVGQDFAGQFGGLSAARAMAQIAQQRANADANRESRMQLIGMGGNTSNGQLDPKSINPATGQPWGVPANNYWSNRNNPYRSQGVSSLLRR